MSEDHQSCIQYGCVGLTMIPDLCAEKLWKSMSWVDYNGTVPIMKALRAVIGWRTAAWWITRKARGMNKDPGDITGCQTYNCGISSTKVLHGDTATWQEPPVIDNDCRWNTTEALRHPHRMAHVIPSTSYRCDAASSAADERRGSAAFLLRSREILTPAAERQSPKLGPWSGTHYTRG